MKKSLFFYSFILSFFFLNLAFATNYLPNSGSSQYLPTVKIHTFDLEGDSLTPYSLGSGTLIDKKGRILTNNHVVQDYYDSTVAYDTFQICLSKANDTENPICQFTASLIARNADLDLALLQINDTDVLGNNVDFGFYLPYKNDGTNEVGDKLTVLGYPDTGGKTLTVTSGIISGFLSVGGVTYLKTDADISFGNSGGTGIDENGNLLGVPTFISNSNSSETLGYLLPISEAISWINENINIAPTINEDAENKLESEMKKFIEANEQGAYTNEYPAYTISTIDGWKFGNSLESAFDGENYSYSSSSDTVSIFPEDKSDAYLSIVIFSKSLGYEVSTEIILGLTEEYKQTYYGDNETAYTYEEVKLNDKYDAVKETETYTDYWSAAAPTITTVAYNIPYGDRILRLAYSYSVNDEDKLAELDKMISTLTIDFSKVSFEPLYSVTNEEPYYQINLPENLKDDFYMQATDYTTYINNKEDSSFYFYFSKGVLTGTFDEFMKTTEEGATIYDGELVSSGNLIIDGMTGKYFTIEYSYDSSKSIYTNIYLDLGDSYYLAGTYLESEQNKYNENIKIFKEILKNIKTANNGEGKYKLPNFSKNTSKELVDIKNYIYENFIKHLDDNAIFGEDNISLFNPEKALSRKDFILWTVKSYLTFKKDDFDEFEKTYNGCSSDCFSDLNYDKKDSVYIAYAKYKGAIAGQEIDGKKYLKPDDQISLMAALKILFTIYEYNIWEAPSYIPWYIPYLQLGYSEGIMPYGLQSIDYMLTRGEGTYMIDLLMRKNNEDYYDDYYEAVMPNGETNT